MTPDHLHNLVAHLTSLDESQRQQAQETLFREDEDIIPALIDEFYAGIGVPTGTALLEVIGQIGGYQATALFLELLENAVQPSWSEIAERWLRHDGIL